MNKFTEMIYKKSCSKKFHQDTPLQRRVFSNFAGLLPAKGVDSIKSAFWVDLWIPFWIPILQTSMNFWIYHYFPAGNFMFKVNKRNTAVWWEICSNSTIKTSERCHWCRSGVFINFEHISHLALMFLLLTLSR